ncbi:OmpA family protein [Actinomadura parmotrematis]|uniref:OmpA family protein n=1 Tax=Actinomadura parmotrematis TaxID=2864039 RepID=A0ABS7G4J2_9ACTN|nr:OmpA family protein [Actinomadura parmotrematis]MBW8487638.1 OmpA family protein [Actinomadura parmotrematis]
MAVEASAAHLDVLSLNREADRTVTAHLRIVNDGQGTLEPSTILNELGTPADLDNDGGDPLSRTNVRSSASGIGLLDAKGGNLYLPLRTKDYECVCTGLGGTSVRPGASLDVYAVYPALPAAVQRVTVTAPLTVPLQDVPIAGAPAAAGAGRPTVPPQASLAPPRVLPVVSVSEGADEGVDDGPGGRAVRLSSDVLFALNKADLTPRATALLQKVAQQIDASTGTTVKVDGYTDSSGNDAINKPLSGRRAKAVSTWLKQHVTRQGITFTAAGHGSASPVASNDTEEGRRHNRRTTVSFARPVPPAPQISGAPYRLAPGAPPVLGSGAFTPAAASGLKAEVNSLHRDATGLVTLVFTLRNTGTREVSVSIALERNERLHGGFQARRTYSVGGVMLYDTAARVRYEPLKTSNGECLCTSTADFDAHSRLNPGDSAIYSATYLPAAQTSTVELRLPWQDQNGATVTGLTVK